MTNCPICELEHQDVTYNKPMFYYVKCKRCGPFTAERDLVDDMDGWLRKDPLARIIMSQFIRLTSHQKGSRPRTYHKEDMASAMRGYVPATVDEQITNLLLCLGARISDPGKGTNFDLVDIQSEIRCLSKDGLKYLLQGLKSERLLTWNTAPTINGIRQSPSETITLTFAGWKKVNELRQVNPNSKTAFMAMKFGEPDLDALFEGDLTTSVKATGFRLERVIDQPKAGLIDARMMLMIKNSRFVIADLTHGNNGAYWEAGYAEGLGRPVIYICHASKREDKSISHFDTNHRQTVFWGDDPAAFRNELKAIIRLTITEANQIDR